MMLRSLLVVSGQGHVRFSQYYGGAPAHSTQRERGIIDACLAHKPADDKVRNCTVVVFHKGYTSDPLGQRCAGRRRTCCASAVRNHVLSCGNR